MKKIISIVNDKSLVGKTTTSILLAYNLMRQHNKVLIIDLDPKASCSNRLGYNKENIKYSSLDLFHLSLDIFNIIKPTKYNNLDIVPSLLLLSSVDSITLDITDRYNILKSRLSVLHSLYDYIIFDLPPSLGFLTTSALVASTSLIIPIYSEPTGLNNLIVLLSFLFNVKQKHNNNLEFEGILHVASDKRTGYSQTLESKLNSLFTTKLFKETISIDKNMKNLSLDLIIKKQSKAFQDYLQLAKLIDQ